MDGISGVEAAQRLKAFSPDCVVIFLTSSMDHIHDGFRLRAWRYLLKPIKPEWLEEALGECISQLQRTKRQLSVTIDRKETLVPFSHIYYIATANRSVEIHGRDIQLTTGKQTTFAELAEQLLADDSFLLIGKGLLVNLGFVERVEDTCVVIVNGSKLPVSRSKRSEVSAAVVQFRFQHR